MWQRLDLSQDLLEMDSKSPILSCRHLVFRTERLYIYGGIRDNGKDQSRKGTLRPGKYGALRSECLLTLKGG